jgi:hypothetical protein
MKVKYYIANIFIEYSLRETLSLQLYLDVYYKI